MPTVLLARFWLKAVLIWLGLLAAFPVSAQLQKAAVHKTFTNPLLPDGADPWVLYKDGYYYYTNTSGNNLTIRKTRSLADLRTAPKQVIWVPPANELYSKNIWAPELHFLDNKWYMYFAGDDGRNENHRLYVIENTSPDPFTGEWVFKGKLADDSNCWAIDGSVFTYQNQLYLIWSGWDGATDGQQNIYIAKMKNPYTLEGKRVKISGPQYEWETFGDIGGTTPLRHVNVNEGPEILMHGKKIYLIFSASGCWTDHYTLGMLTATAGTDLLNPASWKKHIEPVFSQSKENGVYAPGHNSFFKSPDGREDWIVYHANPQPGCGCGGRRSPRMQKFTWNADGTPNFGIPVKTDVPINLPSGD